MEYNILLNLNTGDKKLNCFVDDMAGVYIDHGIKAGNIIKPGEKDFSRKHLHRNILATNWGRNEVGVEWKENQFGAYDYVHKQVLLSPIFNDGGELGKRINAIRTGIHEVGHAMRFDDHEPAIPEMQINDVGDPIDEILNCVAEDMISLSYFRNGGVQNVRDAWLELKDDGKLVYVIMTQKGRKIEMESSNYWSYPGVFRVVETLGMSIVDAIRCGMVLQRNDSRESVDKFATYFSPFVDGNAKLTKLAPFTPKDYKRYIAEISKPY